MFEPEEATSIIEIAIQTGDTTADTAVEQILELSAAEEMVKRTLQTVQIQQAVSLSVLVTSDEEIAALNRQYRQQDKPTDVLSFPLQEQPLVQAPAEWLWQTFPEDESEESASSRPVFVTPVEPVTNLGDIAISWPTVQRQAETAGHSAAYELLFLLCHGVLHLVGYDDQTEAGYAEMVRLQKEILAGMTREK